MNILDFTTKKSNSKLKNKSSKKMLFRKIDSKCDASVPV